ncbi:cyclic nucleotide-gated cation channel subunit a [Holotrichia oblita]|uniref:Cyclic nucleotide-gated cation channel subunit a n=1 Tax=Holotrichia oblita TaxID=644536 RepID=A0ACB9TH02_HOLOL|nr:cyclic nucleotide-gated cation channel subunit a [Holotrichia oblita]
MLLLIAGIITSGGRMIGERLSGSGTRLEVSSPVQSAAPTIGGVKSSTESVHRALKSVSRQSLLDLVTCKLGMSKPHQQHYFNTSHESFTTAYAAHRPANVSSAASELDLSRKVRRKDIRGRLKLPASVALASSGEAPLLGGWRTTPGSTAGTNPPSSNHLNSTSSCNGTERNSTVRARFENGEFGENLLVGDSGYGNKPYLFTPLSNRRTPVEHLFNEAQIRTRNPIERCFGVLKRRFPILTLGIKLNVQKVEAIVASCAVLHNVTCMLRDDVPLVGEELEMAIELGNIAIPVVQQGVVNIALNNIVRQDLITEYFQQCSTMSTV